VDIVPADPGLNANPTTPYTGHDQSHPVPHGHVVLVMTPNDGAKPSYRAYLVAENDPLKARSLLARHVRTDEIAYVLAAFPDVLQQIPGLGAGGVLRL
jgi:hypothetical protein